MKYICEICGKEIDEGKRLFVHEKEILMGGTPYWYQTEHRYAFCRDCCRIMEEMLQRAKDEAVGK